MKDFIVMNRIVPLNFKLTKCAICGRPVLSDSDPAYCDKCVPPLSQADYIRLMKGKGFHFSQEEGKAKNG